MPSTFIEFPSEKFSDLSMKIVDLSLNKPKLSIVCCGSGI
jgi:hypothetical protein